MTVEETLGALEWMRRLAAQRLGLDNDLARTAWIVDREGALGLKVEFDVPALMERVEMLWLAGELNPVYKEQAKESVRRFVRQGAVGWGDCEHLYYPSV